MGELSIVDYQSRVWLLLIVTDEEQQYAGNSGYADQLSQMYEYDNDVPYCNQVSEGDLVLLRNTTKLLGVARIQYIDVYKGTKERLLCPECGISKIKPRKKKKPKFRCREGHLFDTPIPKIEECKKFKANYSGSFVPSDGAVSLEDLKQAWLNKSKQLSMRPIDFQRIEATLVKNSPMVAKLLKKTNDCNYLKANDADDNKNISEYLSTEEDSRKIVFRQRKERRGQSKFREVLCKRYGDQCMITGLKFLDVLEAAHISPYRGTDDNHPDNGLLLRADLHTLFDLNLLGINPESLEVKFHPKVMETGYHKWEGRKLICSKYKPSQSALESRWKQFLNCLNEHDEN
ncbi:HNH endonuclease [Nostoc sp.]|uniref:HNH endonuclease n=1 Tax=Nostoc sp. TaxID=1180 RepID=UPI002FF60EED